MRRRKYIMYIIVILLIAILISGFKTYSGYAEKQIKEANAIYNREEYEKAGEIYKAEMGKGRNKARLSYNLGNVKYQTEKYQDALELYKKAPDSSNKYLLLGNTSFTMAEGEQNQGEKMGLYQQALEFYREGILRNSREVNLKYNYEYVKKKLEEMQNEQQQKKDQRSDGQNDKENKKQQDNEQKQENNQHQKESKDKGNLEENRQEKNGDQNQGNENKQGDTKDKEQGANQTGKQGKGNTDPLEQSPDKQEDTRDRQQIMQVLKILEKQEEDSLKNNQTLHRSEDKGEKYDW